MKFFLNKNKTLFKTDVKIGAAIVDHAKYICMLKNNV